MDCQDAQVSSITVILRADWAEDLAGAVKMLKDLGMEVERADDDNSVVEGTIEACKLAELNATPCVAYVRIEMTYVADYPPGDPRDRNGR